MADMIQSGLAWLTEQRAAHASTPCTLLVGQASRSVRATLTRKAVEVVGEGGAILIVETMTAIIPLADVGTVRPKNGDRLTATGLDFVVHPPAAGAKAWDWVDSHNTAIRVYLRERNAEHAPG